MGDAIEKAIFSFEELWSGPAKLQAAGYIRPVENGFELEQKVTERFKSGSHAE